MAEAKMPEPRLAVAMSYADCRLVHAGLSVLHHLLEDKDVFLAVHAILGPKGKCEFLHALADMVHRFDGHEHPLEKLLGFPVVAVDDRWEKDWKPRLERLNAIHFDWLEANVVNLSDEEMDR